MEEDGDLGLRAELTRRFEEEAFSHKSPSIDQPGRRTVGQILAARNALHEAKQRKVTEEAAKERARLQEEKAQARDRYLDELALREPNVWLEISKLIAMKSPSDDDHAIALLLDLKDLAVRTGRTRETDARIRDLREIHRKKTSFIQRLKVKNLI
jgi:hypothetical protein